MSASEQLIKAEYTTREDVDAMLKELELVERNPNAVFLYSFMQAVAVTE